MQNERLIGWHDFYRQVGLRRIARLAGRLLAEHLGKLTTTPLSKSLNFETFYCFCNPTNTFTAKKYGLFNTSGAECYWYRPYL